MWTYILRRVFQALFTLLIITVLCFLLTRFSGDPIAQYAANPRMSAEDKAALRERLGLNDPLYVQYFRWLGLAVQGGMSAVLLICVPFLVRLPSTVVSADTIVAMPLAAFPPSWFLGVEHWMQDPSRVDGYAAIARYVWPARSANSCVTTVSPGYVSTSVRSDAS